MAEDTDEEGACDCAGAGGMWELSAVLSSA